MHLILFALTLLSFFAGMLFLHRSRLQIPTDILPAASASILVCFLFFACCLDIWAPCVLLLQVGGVAYSFYAAFLWLRAYRRGKFIFVPPAIAFFAVASLACIVFLRDATYLNPDVYSHWGRIVKEMLSFQGFATPASTITINRDYPTGAALFITYFLQATGYSNSLTIICQGILASALFSAVFIGASWKRPLSLLLRLGLIVLTLGGFTSTVHDLMIDYVVTLSGVAALIAIYFYWQTKEQQRTHQLIWLMALVCLPSMLKSSGIIFTVMGIVSLVLLYAICQKPSPKKLCSKRTLLPVGLLCMPFVISYLWTSYLTHAWRDTGAPEPKFGLSLASMQTTFLEKDAALRQAIVRDTLHELIVCRNNRFLFVPLLFLLCVFLFQKSARAFLKTPLWVGISAWLLYHIGYIFMMIFMMPAGEVAWSTTLGYTRYIGMITMAISIWWYWLLLTYYKEVALQMAEITSVLTVCAGAVLSCGLLAGSYLNLTFYPTVLNARQLEYQQIEAAAAICAPYYTRAENLLIYSGDTSYVNSPFCDDSYATIFLTKNTLSCCNTYAEADAHLENPEQLMKFFTRSDYFIIVQDSDGLAELLNRYAITIDTCDGTLYTIYHGADGSIALEKVI